MSSPAQITANQLNAQSSTGPRTEHGKSNSAKNATRHGLFSQGDFVRPGEESAYKTLLDALNLELHPAGILEESHVAEIRRATWRLEMCAEREGELAAMLAPDSVFALDALRDETIARFQNSIDRARSQAQRQLIRATAELRRLQTERQYRNEIFPKGTDISRLGICDYRSVTKGIAERDRCEFSERKSFFRRSLAEIDAGFPGSTFHMPTATFSGEEDFVTERTQSESEPAAKRTQSAASTKAEIARNAQCPCNSGRKYKRCCGKNAPAMRTAA